MQVVVVQSITKAMLDVFVYYHKASCQAQSQLHEWLGTSPTPILDVTYYSWQTQLPQTSKVTMSKSLTKAHIRGERDPNKTLEEGCCYRGQNVSMLEK
jgi:hypothetical protein